MRINDNTIAYHSILWVAQDVAGHIIIALSNEGEIPAFVKENEEHTEQVARVFSDLCAVDRNRQLDLDLLTGKGYFCYVNDDPYEGKRYHLIAKPENPVNICDLDEKMQILLQNQMLNFNAQSDDYFTF